MAAEDFAILTGISWYPNPGFTSLQGPTNDIELVKNWLLTKGGVPPTRIEMILSPAPPPAVFTGSKAQPTRVDFEEKFRELLEARTALGEARVKGRLYLYFSGHGFCNRSQDRTAEAALYCANATPDWIEHIFGTHFARVAAARALFQEVVLIMDCCRDSELNKSPTPSHLRDTPDDALAASVRLLCIYATPKGGKAQEKTIAERGGAIHGLLTHALIKLLEEASASSNLLSATDLKARLEQSWTAICGEDGIPKPEVHLPANGDIQFPTGGRGSPFEFRWTTPVPAGSTLTLIAASNAGFATVATISVNGDTADQLGATGQVLDVQRGQQNLTVRMAQGFYKYKLSDPQKEDLFVVDGGDRYVNL